MCVTIGVDKPGSHVEPGQNFTYVWQVLEGPSPTDAPCIPYLYFSGTDPVADTNSGLVGPLLVCKKGALGEKGTQVARLSVPIHTFYVTSFTHLKGPFLPSDPKCGSAQGLIWCQPDTTTPMRKMWTQAGPQETEINVDATCTTISNHLMSLTLTHVAFKIFIHSIQSHSASNTETGQNNILASIADCRFRQENVNLCWRKCSIRYWSLCP